MFEGVLGIIANGAVTMVLWYGAKLMYEGHVSAGVLTCEYTQPYCCVTSGRSDTPNSCDAQSAHTTQLHQFIACTTCRPLLSIMD